MRRIGDFALAAHTLSLSARFRDLPHVISVALKSQYYYNILNGHNVTYNIKYALASALNKLNIMAKRTHSIEWLLCTMCSAQ